MGQLLYVEGLITPVMQLHAVFHIGKANTPPFLASRRLRAQTQTTVNHTDYQSFILAAQFPAATQTAGLAGYVEMDIPAYSGTTFDKMVKIKYSGTNSNLSWDWESSAFWQSG